MKIFRNKRNGMLYTIERVSPRGYTGRWYEATPYNHSVPAYERKKHADLEDFVVVSER